MSDTKQTKTDQIFQLTAPWDNPYQGRDLKLVFVCSAGILRSATAANMYASNYNTRCCGSSSYALIPLSANLIAWGNYIIFMNDENYKEALATFKGTEEETSIVNKAFVLDIPDRFDYRNPQLMELIKEQLAAFNL